MIPNAVLIQVSPDLVGVLELSEVFECTKQNIQKYVNKESFPKAFFKGSQAIWHLDEVLEWFLINKEEKVDTSLLDVARLARSINLSLETQELVAI